MVARKERDIWQFGDFQTPPKLAQEVCTALLRRNVEPGAIIEPTCGRGAFLKAAEASFPAARRLVGVEINASYVEEARTSLGSIAQVEQGNFFEIDWDTVLAQDSGPWLVLGNPPWVTNAELGLLKSTNLPTKSNFQGYRGLDAITGKANFDISEWMLLKQLEWLKNRSGWIAMLVKTSVARKILKQAWRRGDDIGQAAIYKIDAMRHFGAAVEACLLVLPVGIGEPSQDCDVFGDISDTVPQSVIGFHDELLVSDAQYYMRHRDFIGSNTHYVWRSGVKHDCSKVMELSEAEEGMLVNGFGERVDLEPDVIFPLLKSSDVAKERTATDRFVIVTQKEIGEDTSYLARSAPKTWSYLVKHADKLDARGSVIYRDKPRFSVFGVGAYAFAPWKVAISGFYKSFNFMKVGPVHGKPIIVDDTVYFLPCRSEEEADFIVSIVRSRPFSELLRAMVFSDEKRPITAELLKRISIERVSRQLRLAATYEAFANDLPSPQLSLAFG